MRRKSALVTLAIGMAACSSIAFSRQSAGSQTDASLVNLANGIVITDIRLAAREERGLPPGQSATADRDIGFADVVVQIQNTSEEAATLIIRSIEIRSAFGGRVQMVSQNPQAIQLRPLENSALDFHLTNKTGYSRGDRVRAIVHYQIQEQAQAIESAPTTIERL